jgi:Tol biopolymer transport system component/C-terminal processing protease CtpA/Prc
MPLGAGADDAPATLAAYGEPGLSPDHREIAFVSGGDIWSVPAAGGDARLLAATGGYASRPLFSPDGTRIAYVSSQPGANGIYVLTLAGGALHRITSDDATPELANWSPDGKAIYFSSAAQTISGMDDVMRVPADGGTPARVVHEDYVTEDQAAPNADGRIAYVRNGFPQWWRRGHSHIDESELVIASDGVTHFDELTHGDAKDRWPMWGADGRTLYFASDRGGHDELWRRSGGRMSAVTSLQSGRVVWPSISRDGALIAFEREMRIWTYDTASGTAREVPITLHGLSDTLLPSHVTYASRFSALDLSPDGKKVAFVARGHVFATDAAQGGEAQAVPLSESAAHDVPVWASDSRRVAYVVDRGAEQAIAMYTFPDGPERVLTPRGHHDDYPHWSPDGTSIAFIRDGRELRLLDVASGGDKLLAHVIADRRPFGDDGDIAFSPAGDMIAFIDQTKDGFTNPSVVRTTGGPPQALAVLANGNAGPLAWSPDGTRLFFVTSQRTENGQVAQIDLIPRAPRFREDQFRRLFDGPPELPSTTVPTPVPSGSPRALPSAAASGSPAPRRTAPAKRTTRIDFEGIRERLTMLPIGIDAQRVNVTPDGKTLVVVGAAAGQQNIYTFPVDETSDDPQVAKQITTDPGQKTIVHITPSGAAAIYLSSGRIWNADLGGKGARPLAVSAALDLDPQREHAVVFQQAWSLLERWYADPGFHGTDWNAMRARYAPYAAGAPTTPAFYRILDLMIGELDSSHSGVRAPNDPNAPRLRTGRIGVDWDSAELQRTGALRIAHMLPLGPAVLSGHLAVGDVLLAVDGREVNAHEDVASLFANTTDKRTELRVAPHGDAASAHNVTVLPISTPDEESLRYLAWVAERRAYVERISGGRLGYVHLAAMGDADLQKFYQDLDLQNRAKSGVVIDIRNNDGGFVDPYTIDVLTRRTFVHFKSRFGYDTDERSSLGQRVLPLPTVLVTNSHTLSDGENLTEAYRALHAGKVVGEPTAGWIIFTSNVPLADGGTVRLPSTSVITQGGVNMELHPRPVDVDVVNPPGAAERGDDPQLDAAVKTLLRR